MPVFRLPMLALSPRSSFATRCFTGLIVAALSIGAAHAAPLFNGALSTGFSGWSGSTDTPHPTDPFDLIVTVVDPSTDSHFTTTPAPTDTPAKLTLVDTDDVFGLSLFQVFDLPTNALELSFNFAWDLTDGVFSDSVQALLSDATGVTILLDLFSGVNTFLDMNSGAATVDVSAFAGDSVRISFSVQDGDLVELDMFSIGNIGISQATAVPEPDSLALVALALFLVRAVRFKRA